MKLNGQKLDRNLEIIVLPRGNGNDLIFKAQAVLSYEAFEKMCPPPKPPVRLVKGGGTVIATDDKNYTDELTRWAILKTDFMCIESLKATEGLEWETVVESDPSTWHNFENELRAESLTDQEISRIYDGILSACGLNQTKIEAATKNFLAGAEAE